MVVLADLVAELKMLRKGRGIFVSRIDERIGPSIREVCDVTAADGPVVIRQKITRWLENLVTELPNDLRVAVLAAFAICPDARMPLYQDRVGWAAKELDRDSRTVRRRVDDGILQLAQLATVRRSSAPRPGRAAEFGWHTGEVRVMLALDRPRPEAVEIRRIVADRDDLTELDLPVTLAAPDAGEFDIDVFYGGTLVDRGMESSARHGFALQLHRPLARGETLEFALHYRLPKRSMPPYFVCVPKRPCGTFDLRIRFDRTMPPQQVWLLRDAFERDVEDPVRSGDPRPVDSSGEVHAVFHNLIPGLTYGVRWD